MWSDWGEGPFNPGTIVEVRSTPGHEHYGNLVETVVRRCRHQPDYYWCPDCGKRSPVTEAYVTSGCIENQVCDRTDMRRIIDPSLELETEREAEIA